MFPQYSCNLLATLSHLSSEKELDWSLHTTIEWETRVPFHAYVRRDFVVPPTHGQGSSFPKFTLLPTELQLYIIALCPANTLFQVMHVSSSLRNEASKLFWATPTASFHVEASWLLEGGYPGGTYCDLPFLYHVQKVEIIYRRQTDSTLCCRINEKAYFRHDLIVEFWQSLECRLPNAKEVVFVQIWETRNYWPDEEEPIAPLMRMLIQACPPSIKVAALRLEESSFVDNHAPLLPTQRFQRSFYQYAASGKRLKSHGPDRCNTTILVPTKQFNGPVGEFQKLIHDGDNISYQRNATWPLIIEAVERHYFGKQRNTPFACPLFNCTAHFTKAGEWSVHAVESHWEASRGDDCIDMLPDVWREAIYKHFATVNGRDKKIQEQHGKLFDDWNAPDKHKRREIQRNWMHQLKHDPAWDTGEKPGQSKLWAKFWQRMHAIYHFT